MFSNFEMAQTLVTDRQRALRQAAAATNRHRARRGHLARRATHRNDRPARPAGRRDERAA